MEYLASHSQPGSTVNANSDKVVCVTCLSVNRLLYSLASFPHLKNVCNGIEVRNLNGNIMEHLASHSQPGSTVNANSDKVVCVTCLSVNRFLHSLARFPHLKNVCNGIELTFEDMVCWECKSILVKVWRFQQRALKSMTTLSYLLKNKKVSSKADTIIFKTPLSSLGYSKTYSIDNTQEIKQENEDNAQDQKPSSSFVSVVKVKIEYESSESEPNRGNNDVTKAKQTDEESENNVLENQTNKVEDSGTSNKDIIARSMNEDEMLSAREKERNQDQFMMSTYKCDRCIQIFFTQKLLTLHNKIHCKTQGDFQCNVCEQRFKHEDAQINHTKSHYRYYECKNCGFRNQFLGQVMEHCKKNHEIMQIHRCKDCSAEFRNARRLKYHRETVHIEKPKCDQCGKEFMTTFSLKRHVSMHFGVEMLECKICHKKYRGTWGLRAHMRTHDDKVHEDAYCAECGVQYKNVYLYRMHLKNNRRHVAPEDLKFECSDCGKRFTTKTYVKTHIETIHVKKANYFCSVCKKGFYAAVTRRRHHREKHEGRVKSRNNICKVCGKDFTAKSSLSQHMNTHVGARPYKCKLCEATFSYHGALYTHTKLVHLRAKRTDKVTLTDYRM